MKPCPFCGNKLETAPDGVFEETCRCRTKSMTVKEWNTRPIEDVLRSENEQMKKALNTVAYGFMPEKGQESLCLSEIFEYAQSALNGGK